MRESILRHRRKLVALGLLAAGVAWASPWDIDMIDGVSSKAYEWRMLPARPEGTVQRESAWLKRPKASIAYQNAYVEQADRTTPEGQALTSPLSGGEDDVARGKRLFGVTCAPCHGAEGRGGGAVTTNDPTANPPIRRYPVPAPLLSGAGAVSAQRSDGYIYLTIRNGGAVMPAYGSSLTEEERWSIVAYIRTLDGGAYVPPAPPTTAGTPE
jgi:mono/diheme cytochrome c family protein